MNNEDLVEIYRAKNVQQAALLKNLLEDEGIDAQVSNEGIQAGIGEGYGGWSFAPQVLVRRSDAEHARALANDWDEELVSRASLDESEEDFLEGQADSWQSPLCLVCKEPRLAICPNCETSGTDFEPAELVQPDGSGGILALEEEAVADEIDLKQLRLMCTVCDKSFLPQYLQHCRKCGYDFGDGIEISPHASDSQMNGRVLIAILTMLILGLAAAAYFLFITK